MVRTSRLLALLVLASPWMAAPLLAQTPPPPPYQQSQDVPPPGAEGPPPGYEGAPPPGPQNLGPGRGQMPHHSRMRERFEAANTTNDGRLTLQQAEAAQWRGVVRNFHRIDADNKGYITIQDMRAWARARHNARSATQGAGGPGMQPPPGGQQYPGPEGPGEPPPQ